MTRGDGAWEGVGDTTRKRMSGRMRRASRVVLVGLGPTGGARWCCLAEGRGCWVVRSAVGPRVVLVGGYARWDSRGRPAWWRVGGCGVPAVADCARVVRWCLGGFFER